MPVSLNWSLSYRFSTQNVISHVLMHDTSPAHLAFLDVINLIIFGEEHE